MDELKDDAAKIEQETSTGLEIEKTDVETGPDHVDKTNDKKPAPIDEKRLERAKKRTLCKLVKKNFVKKHLKEYKELVKDPMWVCRTCGRAAHDAKSLCKPARLIKVIVDIPHLEE